nr:MAG TPA: minor tail protein [Caudoviricetes sp.]
MTRELKKKQSKKNKLIVPNHWWDVFDTGGYTGDWGTSDGKVALLHEKELVLNKKDTANILDSVNIVRDMNNQINRNIRYASFAQQVAAQIKGQL